MSKIDELKNKYSSITNQMFEKFVEGDTTPTKKYLEFLLKSWSKRQTNGCVRTSSLLIELVNSFDAHLPYIENKDIYHKDYTWIPNLQRIVENAETEKDEQPIDLDRIAEEQDMVSKKTQVKSMMTHHGGRASMQSLAP